MEERKNLLMRKMKGFLADNEIIQQYFARTDDQDVSVKRRKRILGLPGLLIHLLFHRKYR